MSRPIQHSDHGFTLIELVVVIVILGILAATALPKFVDLGKDARIAALNGLAGAIRSAAFTFRTKCATADTARTQHNYPAYPNSWIVTFTSGGVNYHTLNCYPDAGWLDPNTPVEQGYIETLIDYDTSVFEVTAPTIQISRFLMKTAPNPDTCYAQYQQTLDISVSPTITTETSGC